MVKLDTKTNLASEASSEWWQHYHEKNAHERG